MIVYVDTACDWLQKTLVAEDYTKVLTSKIFVINKLK